jgi:hypothetical protein
MAGKTWQIGKRLRFGLQLVPSTRFSQAFHNERLVNRLGISNKSVLRIFPDLAQPISNTADAPISPQKGGQGNEGTKTIIDLPNDGFSFFDCDSYEGPG